MKDTGTGIDPEIMPRLFTKFVSKSVAGTGLGLFISKSIVEAHGGKMWGENNADGKEEQHFTLAYHQVNKSIIVKSRNKFKKCNSHSNVYSFKRQL